MALPLSIQLEWMEAIGGSLSFLSNVPEDGTEADDSVVQISRRNLKLKLGVNEGGGNC